MKLIYYRIQLNYSCEIVVIKLSFVPSLDDQLKAGEGERTWEFSIFNFFLPFRQKIDVWEGEGERKMRPLGPRHPECFSLWGKIISDKSTASPVGWWRPGWGRKLSSWRSSELIKPANQPASTELQIRCLVPLILYLFHYLVAIFI